MYPTAARDWLKRHPAVLNMVFGLYVLLCDPPIDPTGIIGDSGP
jgi:hypothetical protein